LIFVKLYLRSESQMALSTERAIAIVMIGHVMQMEANAAGRPCAPQLSSQTIPEYLQRYYWWAYIHPNAVRLFERQWLVNAILWGNLARLRDAVLDELGAPIRGRTLQVACVYGDFSVRLAERVAAGSSLDVIDMLPIQLQNLRRKLAASAPVALYQRNATALGFADATYDQAVIFFLLHEQPPLVRQQTISEALRVVKPGGKLLIVDYHRPAYFHPLRYLLRPLLRALEPYALDLWQHDFADWLPTVARLRQIRKQTFYSGLYQKLLITV
jgi:ubiquinone/menaquinone biosynthesis C-methylase UbiE